LHVSAITLWQDALFQLEYTGNLLKKEMFGATRHADAVVDPGSKLLMLYEWVF